MTNDLSVPSVITPMSPILSTPVFLVVCTHVSPGVSTPVVLNVTKFESTCVPTHISSSVSSPNLSSTLTCDPSHHHIYIIQHSHDTTSVSQVSNGVV